MSQHVLSARRWLRIATLVAAVPAMLTAQEAETEELMEMELDALLTMKVTTVSKRAQAVLEAPSNITIVTDKQIKEWGVRDLKDLMRRVAGCPVIADRDEWVFAFRGNVSDNNQKYLILIDGHRMNSIENFGPGQIIELPNNLSNVKRVEIIRGPGSAVWGPDALAGVINIITKNAEDLDGMTYNVSATVGLDEYVVADMQIGKVITDDVDFMLMGSFAMQHGREISQSAATPWPYLDEPSDTTRIDMDPDTNSLALTHPYGEYTTLLDNHRPGYMLQFKANAKNFHINSFAFSTDVYNRHFEYGRDREAYLSTHKTFIEGAYTNTFWEDLDLEVKLSSDVNRAEYQPFTLGDTATRLMTNIVWLDRRFTAGVELAKPVGDWLNLNGGVDYTFSELGPNQRINGLNPDEPKDKSSTEGFWFDPYLEDHQVGGYLTADIRPLEWMALSGGIRADYNRQRGDDRKNFNPRGALMLFPFESSAFKVIYNRGYLRPANFQSAGSDEVSSETMNQLEAQWLQKLGPLSYTVTGYWQKLEGFINILQGFGFANTGDYISRGVELDANLSVGNHDVWLNGYYSYATGVNFPDNLAYNDLRVGLPDEYGNRRLLSYPPWIVNLGATLRFLKDNALYCTPSVRLVAPTEYRQWPAADQASDADSNYATTDLFTYVDLNIGWQPSKHVGFSVYIDNLLNVTDPTHLTVWNGTIEQYGIHVSGKLHLHL
ncbi:MAG: TonB-dependent receptor plug domain-containing protein [Chitinivibrionales bacterium]|nr:TonB-dependent receptor plug domain-containing protein [Chitinivibrionales bacterium]